MNANNIFCKQHIKAVGQPADLQIAAAASSGCSAPGQGAASVRRRGPDDCDKEKQEYDGGHGAHTLHGLVGEDVQQEALLQAGAVAVAVRDEAGMRRGWLGGWLSKGGRGEGV